VKQVRIYYKSGTDKRCCIYTWHTICSRCQHCTALSCSKWHHGHCLEIM